MTNTTLSNNSLKQYISTIAQMEQVKYRQEKAIETLQSEIARLRNSYVMTKPQMGKMNEIKEFIGGSAVTGVGLIIADVFGIVPSVATSVFGTGSFMDACAPLMAFVGGIALIVRAVNASGENKIVKEKNSKMRAYYKQEMEKYNRNAAEVNAKKKLADVLSKQLGEMRAKKAEMERNLNRAYSYNVIYPSYRNLVAVSSFYDYLYSGKCSTLEGHEGAYNIFDMESRMDKIITQLDRISYQLENIRYSQNTLYTIMKSSNDKLDRMQNSIYNSENYLLSLSRSAALTNSQLERIECNAELTRFNTEQMQREIELRNRVDGIISCGRVNQY